MILYFPLSYLFISRLKKWHEKISWFIIYPGFLLLCCFLYNGSFVSLLLSFMMTMSIYEIGYLDNDYRTINTEKAPTIRGGELRDTIKSKLSSIIFIRVVYFFVSFALLIYQSDIIAHHYTVIYFVLCIGFLIISFYLHNTIRDKRNIITYFSLVSCRYIIPLIPTVTCSVFFVFIILLLFPLIRTLEHACKEKYGIKRLKDFIIYPDLFRVKYYFFFFDAAIVYAYIYQDWKIVLLSGYFLFYRYITFKVSDKNFVKRTHHGSYKWNKK
ncbi:hypothetical protein DM384_01095 [Shigella boydii]|nr:hypothetical protein [Shigella boydii]